MRFICIVWAIPKSKGLWYIPKLLQTRTNFALVYGVPHKHGARLVSRENKIYTEVQRTLVYKKPIKVPAKLDPKQQQEFIKQYHELKTKVSTSLQKEVILF